MPNHITNIITASKEVIDAMRGEGGQIIDFNQLIPMPDGLQDAVSSSDATSLIELITGKANPAAQPTNILDRLRQSNALAALSKDGLKAFRDDAAFENFIQLCRNYRAHGYATWYDWAPEKWGTKWNAYDATISEDGCSVQFDTAWSAPHPVIEALAAKFPDICIEHKWADEDIGSNYGHRRYCQGITDLPVDDPVAYGCGIKGYDLDEYIAERAEDDGDVPIETTPTISGT